MVKLSKGCKPDNFESHNSLTLSPTYIKSLHSNFVECESFLESNLPDILVLCEINLDDSVISDNFSVRGYLLLMQKDSVTHMHSLTVYVKEELPCAPNLSLENCRFLLMCSAGFTSFSVLILFPPTITLIVFMHSFLCYFIY